MYRVLLIEESYEIREEVKEFFLSNGKGIFELHTAFDGSDGLEKVRSNEYGLVMADIKQRGDMAIDMCRRIRDNCKCPIVYISDLKDFDKTENAYALGADDLILKPAPPLEFFHVAFEYAYGRKKAVNLFECGGVRMHPVTGLVTVDGRVIDLPDVPMMILKVLMKNKPETVDRQTILKEVWGSGFKGDDRVVDTQIKILRKYLGAKSNIIQTVRGAGYKIRGI